MLIFSFHIFAGGVVARWHVSRNVWQYMLSIALAYFVTLCLYPGIETEIVSCRLHSWMPVIMMAVFNLFDFFGKVGNLLWLFKFLFAIDYISELF